MANNPSFAVTPRIGIANLTTADSGYTTVTNFQTLLVGASSGTRVAEIVVKSAQATNSAAVVRLFAFDGTTNALVDEYAMASLSGSSTAVSQRVSTLYNNLVLPSTAWSLRVTSSITHPFTVTALGADL